MSTVGKGGRCVPFRFGTASRNVTVSGCVCASPAFKSIWKVPLSGTPESTPMKLGEVKLAETK